MVTPEHLPDAVCSDSSQARSASATSSPSLDDIEREHIIRVMGESPTLESAAHKLGINVATLWRRRKRYGLDFTPH